MKSESTGVVGFIHAHCNIYLKLLSFYILIYNIILLGCLSTYWGSSMSNQTFEHPHIDKNDMIIIAREYSTVILGVESGSSYRSIKSSTIRGHP